MKFSNLQSKLDQAKGRRQSVKSQISACKSSIKRRIEEEKAGEGAKAFIRTVAKQTQEQLQYRVSELSSLALRAVIESEMDLELAFEERRGKTEADLLLRIGDEKIPPKDNVGGGVIDILGMTLRFALWSLMKPRSRPVFILDEPLKWLKGSEMPVKGMSVISEISHKLDVQVIMVSHSPELIAGADKVIEI